MVFYSTPLFVSLGLGQDSAFLSSVITGVVFVLATIVAVFTVDRFGRRVRSSCLHRLHLSLPQQCLCFYHARPN